MTSLRLAGALLAMLSVLPCRAQLGGERVLHSFTAGPGDGQSPYSPVLLGADGALYGTTWGAGAKSAGTIFRINPDGSSYAVLRSFTNTPDGATPFAGLIQGRDGVLYGATYYGGTSNAGTIFKISTNGLGYAVLRSFTDSPDGANPHGSLVQGQDGALYGTTYGGGTAGIGTVFKLNPDGGGYSVLHSFTNAPDGMTPFAGLIQGSDGRLYGTTSGAGAYSAGTVFALGTNGGDYTVLYSFGFFPDGTSPQAPLVEGAGGVLFGTTVSGGSNGYGMVFRLNLAGANYARLVAFTNAPDGANPYAGLTLGADGALYGVTTWGGVTNGGTIYRLSQDGSGYAIMHHLGRVPKDGTQPFASLTAMPGGLCGTTKNGGTNGFGTIFRLTFAPSLALSLTNQAGLVSVTGFPGTACRIEASSNLASWITLTNLVLINGTGQFVDPLAGLPQRFYRAVVP
jgi:uncharacterized repeat protein (TIGR03803 family)